jgi:glycerophosphoryl diester phosphodiesterase
MLASLRRAAPAFLVTSLSATALVAASTGEATSDPVPDAGSSVQARTQHWSPDGPIVVGHRGASGYRPEHTLASYELAARMGADCIEPDVVSTADGVLVARHENEISGTTDVAARPEFADRRTTKQIDGVSVTGWFTEDFTLAELRTLRAKERLPQARQESSTLDGRYQVPTLAEVIKLRASLSRELKRPVCVYIETKHPTYFDSIGLSLEEPLVEELTDAGLNRRRAPVYVQSFELTNLQDLDNELGAKVPLVFLASTGAPYDLASTGDPRTYADLLEPDSLMDLRRDLDGVGPTKTLVIPWEDDGSLGEPTSLVEDAHDAGLVVHPWTFRAENQFLPGAYRSSASASDFGRVIDEMQAYLSAGVDGYFTDQPDLGIEARDEWLVRPLD